MPRRFVELVQLQDEEGVLASSGLPAEIPHVCRVCVTTERRRGGARTDQQSNSSDGGPICFNYSHYKGSCYATCPARVRIDGAVFRSTDSELFFSCPVIGNVEVGLVGSSRIRSGTWMRRWRQIYPSGNNTRSSCRLGCDTAIALMSRMPPKSTPRCPAPQRSVDIR